jgi:hypothetical protein
MKECQNMLCLWFHEYAFYFLPIVLLLDWHYSSNILSLVGFTIDGVWIGNLIYFSRKHTIRNYTLQIIHCASELSLASGTATSDWLFSTELSQDFLNTLPVCNTSAQTAQKTKFLFLYHLVVSEICLFAKPLLDNGWRIFVCFAVVA